MLLKNQKIIHRHSYKERRKSNQIKCRKVAEAVERYFNITNIKTKSRVAELVRARQMATYVLWLQGVPLSTFATYLGMNHATILLCRDRAIDFIENEKGFAKEVKFLVEQSCTL